MINEAEALDDLARSQAPARPPVADIRRRRYGNSDRIGGPDGIGETGLLRRIRRALMFRRHVRAEARQLLGPSRERGE